MERVLELLNRKNHFLEKFLTLNEREKINFSLGNFDSLDFFYQQRESILEILTGIDTELIELSEDLMPSEEGSREASRLMAVKNEYVKQIVSQDLEIMGFIENEKTQIIRELQKIKVSKKAVRQYKSPSFRNIVDEEA